MKILLSEWSEQPHFELKTDYTIEDYGQEFDVPDATVARWQEAIKRYDEAMEEMYALMEHATLGE